MYEEKTLYKRFFTRRRWVNHGAIVTNAWLQVTALQLAGIGSRSEGFLSSSPYMQKNKGEVDTSPFRLTINLTVKRLDNLW